MVLLDEVRTYAKVFFYNYLNFSKYWAYGQNTDPAGVVASVEGPAGNTHSSHAGLVREHVWLHGQGIAFI